MPSYLITGASRGIGLEFTRQLSSKVDNQVFALVRNKGTASELVELSSHAPNVRILQADIVDYKALKTAAAEVANVTGGTLDYLINNAAYIDRERQGLTLDGYPEGQEALLEDDIHKSIQVNVIGVIHTINAFLPLVRKSSIKKVITISSGVADPGYTLASGFATAAPYSISKAALNLAIVKYAAKYQEEGIVFLSISPGVVNTAQKPPTPEEVEGFKKMVATFKKAAPHWDGRPLTPEQSVKMVLDVVNSVTIKDSGAFVSHFGNKQWL
ncbi:NAD(P)-binding protein [Obba rivulosa]|uniref:NAD(P)-binding protein n=1 Tax=Obba rivulosa TaxID=1052685 RepID=A0A8E2B558_9APHY|nr:NAD(P)-binding protein [Obba rivulosa]